MMTFWSIFFPPFGYFSSNVVFTSGPQYRYLFSFIWLLIMSSFSVNSAFGEQIFKIVDNRLPIAGVWTEIGILVSDRSYWSVFLFWMKHQRHVCFYLWTLSPQSRWQEVESQPAELDSKHLANNQQACSHLAGTTRRWFWNFHCDGAQLPRVLAILL